jgi:hypothetical protein
MLVEQPQQTNLSLQRDCLVWVEITSPQENQQQGWISIMWTRIPDFQAIKLYPWTKTVLPVAVAPVQSQWMHLRWLVCNTPHQLSNLTRALSQESNWLRWRDRFLIYAWKTSITTILQSWINLWGNWLSLLTVRKLIRIRINSECWVLLRALTVNSNSSALPSQQLQQPLDWAQLVSILGQSLTKIILALLQRMNSSHYLKWKWWAQTNLDYQEGVKETKA